MNIYFGFSEGQRVTSGGAIIGTVTDPGYQAGDELLEQQCVPVIWDNDKFVSWTRSKSLTKVP